MTGNLHEDLCKFIMTVSRWILKKKKNVSDKLCRQNQDTHFYAQ
jgi:hypothetical protein